MSAAFDLLPAPHQFGLEAIPSQIGGDEVERHLRIVPPSPEEATGDCASLLLAQLVPDMAPKAVPAVEAYKSGTEVGMDSVAVLRDKQQRRLARHIGELSWFDRSVAELSQKGPSYAVPMMVALTRTRILNEIAGAEAVITSLSDPTPDGQLILF